MRVSPSAAAARSAKPRQAHCSVVAAGPPPPSALGPSAARRRSQGPPSREHAARLDLRGCCIHARHDARLLSIHQHRGRRLVDSP
eukprot:6660728-Prymnesium_polylepis.1